MKKERIVITLKNVTVNYPNLSEPRAIEEGGQAFYSCMVSFEKKSENTKKIMAEVEKIIKNEKLPTNCRKLLRDGKEERPDNPKLENSYFFNTKSKYKPACWGKNGNLIDNSEIQGSDTCNISIVLYSYSHLGNSGVAAGLQSLQKVKSGDREYTNTDCPFEIIEDEDLI